MSDSSKQTSVEQDLVTTFEELYNKVLKELEVLYNGVFDPSEGANIAALCLLAQAPLVKIQASAEFRARSLKRDVDFKKAEVYRQAKMDNSGKKITEEGLKHLLNEDMEIYNLYNEQNQAEKEAKELANILNLLKDAHITFRNVVKKDV